MTTARSPRITLESGSGENPSLKKTMGVAVSEKEADNFLPDSFSGSQTKEETMIKTILVRLTLATCLCMFAFAPAFAQYGGGGSSGSGGGGVYTAPKGGYGSGAAIGAGVAAAAAGVGIAYFVLHNHGSLVGCVEQSTEGIKLITEKDKNTYALEGETAGLKPDERVHLKGKKSKDSSGSPTFEVQKVAKDFGPCKT